MIHQKYNKLFLLLLVLLTVVTSANAQIKVEASEKVELMAILSRTAGFREYCIYGRTVHQGHGGLVCAIQATPCRCLHERLTQ